MKDDTSHSFNSNAPLQHSFGISSTTTGVSGGRVSLTHPLRCGPPRYYAKRLASVGGISPHGFSALCRQRSSERSSQSWGRWTPPT